MKIEVKDHIEYVKSEIRYLQAEIEYVSNILKRSDIDEKTKMYCYGRRDTLICLKWNLEDMLDENNN